MQGERALKTAVMVGATGLTGAALLRQLLDDVRFASVTALTRRPTGLAHAKLREQIVDFDAPTQWTVLVRGDVAFSTLGTTRKEAGGLTAQRRVDFDHQLAFAQTAARNAVQSLVLLSSMGASASSRMAYLRMKGQLDEEVSALSIPRVRILRPGMLKGRRARARPSEQVSIPIATLLAALGIARNYRPIAVETVARAMRAAAFDGPDRRRIYSGGALFTLAGSLPQGAR